MTRRWVHVERQDRVGILTIDKPETLNAIDPGVLREIDEAFSELESDLEVGAVVFTGGGDRAFSAGGDIRAMRDMTVEEGRKFVEAGHAVLNRIERSRLVSIAAINGYAFGGGVELALACDIRVASERAVLGLPEVRIGLYPGWGGTQRAARVMGPGRAKLLVLTGDRIPAAEAFSLGLVDKTLPAEELLEGCRGIAQRIAANGPRAVQQAKTAIVYGLEQPLQYGLRLEIEAWMVNFASADRVEGLSAFLEHREPRWVER